MTTDRARMPTASAAAPVLTRAFGASVALHLLGAGAAMFTTVGAVTRADTGWDAVTQLASPAASVRLQLAKRPEPMPSPAETQLQRSDVPAAPPADIDMTELPAMAVDLTTLPAVSMAPRVAVGDGPPPPFAERRDLAAAALRVRAVPPPAAAAPSLPSAARVVEPAPLSSDNLLPTYPEAAMRRHLQGKVEIELSLTAEGRVSAARVLQSSGHELLDQTTLAALRQWRFRPATRDGVPVASLFRQVVTWVIAAAGGR